MYRKNEDGNKINFKPNLWKIVRSIVIILLSAILIIQFFADALALLIVSLGQDKKVISLAESLRSKGVRVQTLMDKGLGKAMEYANGKGIKKVLVVGKEEVKPKATLKIKNMKTGKTITITKLTDLAKKVKR